MNEPITFLWFIPTRDDGRYLGSSVGKRQPDFCYLREFDRALTPSDKIANEFTVGHHGREQLAAG